MNSSWKTLTSSIGTKLVIALTGLALFLFLIGHLAGNLLIFVGPRAFNGYGHALASNPLLVPIELVLLTVIIVHMLFTIRMTRANRAARPIAYQQKERAGFPSRKSAASSTMIYSGLFIAAFVIVHLRGFKYGPTYEVAAVVANGGDTTGAALSGPPVRDLHRLVLELFHRPLIAGFYVLAMVILGFHLRHGVISAFQSLGADHPGFTPRWLIAGKILAFIIAGGFAAIPVIVFFTGTP